MGRVAQALPYTLYIYFKCQDSDAFSLYSIAESMGNLMKNPNRFSTLLYVISFSVSCVTSFCANAAISLDELKAQVHDYVAQQLDASPSTKWLVEVRGLDPRIKLTDCPTGIEFRLTGKQQHIERRNTIQASCILHDKKSLWSIYIPTQVKRMEPAVMTTGHIAAGEVISEEDIKLEFIDTFSLRGQHYAELAQVVGSKTKQPLRPQQLIKSRNLCQVCKGEAVIIEAVGSGLSIKTSGTALEDGTVGQSIRVKNKRSGRKISAAVVTTGRVQIKI